MQWKGLIDTHAHLDFKTFDNDRVQVIARAREAGLAGIVNVGTDKHTSIRTVDLVKEYEGYIWGAVGVHPHEAVTVTGDILREIADLAKEEGILAIGEIGLDFYYDHSPRDIQERVFRAQLRLASSLGLPVIIHSREAEKETLAILKEENGRDIGGVVHCFTGSLMMAKECLTLGFYLGLGGVLTFPKARDLRDIAAYVPLESILLETDCPYMAPVPKRGKRNEPLFTGYVAERLATIKKVPVMEVINQTSLNAAKLFNFEQPKKAYTD